MICVPNLEISDWRLLQAKLYNGELLSSMSCVMVSVMLLVRILFIDTSLHKPAYMFTELSFRLGTSEGLSLGELIRPICITFLYHNLPLFIDICLIMRYYLCLFHCFCMLDDSWRMNCRSLDSDGKGGVLMQFREDQKNTRKYGKIIFSRKTEEARRGGEEGPQGPTPPRRGPTLPRA